MIERWRGRTSIQLMPSIMSTKAEGLEQNEDCRSGGNIDRSRNGERAGQRYMKCAGSSGSKVHSLQVGSLVTLEVKRQTSASSPWHPTNRRILKLFSLDIFGLPSEGWVCPASLDHSQRVAFLHEGGVFSC